MDRAAKLVQLIELERSHRLLVGAIVVCAYAAMYAFLIWHGSRVAETECSVLRVAGGAYCTVGHELDGELYTLPYDDCHRPTRWPNSEGEPANVGSKLDCFYYRSWPDRIFFERVDDRPIRLLPSLVLVAAIGFVGYALRRRSLARSALSASATHADANPYRQRVEPEPDTRRVLHIPLAVGGRSTWIVGGPFLVTGLVAIVLSLRLAWQGGGSAMVTLIFTVMLGLHVPMLVGAFGVLYRSGLRFDAENGVVEFWWGLIRPWFRKYRSFDALKDAEHTVERRSRQIDHYLTLHFAGEKPAKYSRLREQAEREAAQIRDYLADVRKPAR